MTDVIRAVSIISTPNIYFIHLQMYDLLLFYMSFSQGFSQPPLFARARYPNQADTPDELTFRKDEILQVLQKDFNGQVDWWLCRLGKSVGMVPANYLEIFHPHAPKTDPYGTHQKEKEKEKIDDEKADYAVPKSQPKSAQVAPANFVHTGGIPRHELETKYADYDIPRGTPVSRDSEDDMYDRPPRDETDDPTNRDYDLPPVEVTADPYDIYDRPPSNKSSLSNRVSAASLGSSQIYDVPPTSPSAIYDVPPSDMFHPSLPHEGRNSRRSSGDGMDLSNMYENEAEDFLKKNRSELDKEFEGLWQCVYGNNAYWGSDNKVRRRETLQRTITAAKDFDRCLLSLVEFGKGLTIALENSNTKDANFKRKCLAANTILVNKRQEVLSKIDILVEADEKDVPITATVKSLLEGARTIPQAVQAFVILVQANKAILFKSATLKAEETLPVLTKSEVKNRPLPELPQTRPRMINSADLSDADYDFADDPPSTSQTQELNTGISRKRNPNDDLPPLPFATLRKPSWKKGKNPPTNTEGGDYDDIDGSSHIVPPPIPLRTDNNHLSVGNSSGTIKSRNQISRQSSSSNHSNNSDGTSSPRRSCSPERAQRSGSPYGNGIDGHTNGMIERSGSPPQPLKQEDRELLIRYSQQMELLRPGLKEAIEIFLESIKNSDTPKEFVTKSKLAVVAAYKLVYIADALYQKLLHNDIKAGVVSSSNQLVETIKALVSETKTAALQYPSKLSMERMSECLRKLFPAALDLINFVKSPKV